jgi:hypothetical protein
MLHVRHRRVAAALEVLRQDNWLEEDRREPVQDLEYCRSLVKSVSKSPPRTRNKVCFRPFERFKGKETLEK